MQSEAYTFYSCKQDSNSSAVIQVDVVSLVDGEEVWDALRTEDTVSIQSLICYD